MSKTQAFNINIGNFALFFFPLGSTASTDVLPDPELGPGLQKHAAWHTGVLPCLAPGRRGAHTPIRSQGSVEPRSHSDSQHIPQPSASPDPWELTAPSQNKATRGTVHKQWSFRIPSPMRVLWKLKAAPSPLAAPVVSRTLWILPFTSYMNQIHLQGSHQLWISSSRALCMPCCSFQ